VKGGICVGEPADLELGDFDGPRPEGFHDAFAGSETQSIAFAAGGASFSQRLAQFAAVE
jgi:hypothetical protein